MPKLKNTDYNLNQSFSDAASDVYPGYRADRLVSWVKFNSSSMADHGPNPTTSSFYQGDPLYPSGSVSPGRFERSIGRNLYNTLSIQPYDSAVKAVISGSQYSFTNCVVGHTPNHEDDKPFTISLWFNPTTSYGRENGTGAGATTSRTLISRGAAFDAFQAKTVSGGLEYWVQHIQNESAPNEASIKIRLADTHNNAYVERVGRLSIGSPVIHDNWYHVVATYDGRGGNTAWEGLRIYINGVDVTLDNHSTNGSYTSMVTRNTNALVVGNIPGNYKFFASSTGVPDYLNAESDIAELAVWDIDLYEPEIMAIYTATKEKAYQFSSGFLSNPPRVVLGEEDQQPGTYPVVRRDGMPISPSQAFKRAQAVSPFNDVLTENFKSPYAEADIIFNDLPRDARIIKLIGGQRDVPEAEFGLQGLDGKPSYTKTSLSGRVMWANQPATSTYQGRSWTWSFPGWTTNVDPGTPSTTTWIGGTYWTISSIPGAPGEPPQAGGFLKLSGPAKTAMQTGTVGERFIGYGIATGTDQIDNAIVLSLEVARGPWNDGSINGTDWQANQPTSAAPVLGELSENTTTSGQEFLRVQVYTEVAGAWEDVFAILAGNESVETLQAFSVPSWQGGGTLANSVNHVKISSGDNVGLVKLKIHINNPGSKYQLRITQNKFNPLTGGALDAGYNDGTGQNWAFKNVVLIPATDAYTFEFQRGVISSPGTIVVDMTDLSKEQYSRLYLENFDSKKSRALFAGQPDKVRKSQVRRYVRGIQAADKFAKTINEYTENLKIRAIANANTVKLQSTVPGKTGNTPIFKLGPEFKNVEVPDRFTGGFMHKVLYPVVQSYGSTYLNPISQQHAESASPGYYPTGSLSITGSYALADRLTNVSSPNLLIAGPAGLEAPAVTRKGVSDGNPTLNVKSLSKDDLFVPFDDSLIPLPELDFYEEGVADEIKEFFSSPLKDKVMIVIDIEPTSPTQFGFLETESSTVNATYPPKGGNGGPQNVMVYYNFDLQRWETIGAGFTNRTLWGGGSSASGVGEQFFDTACIGFSRGVELSASGTNSACRPINDFGFPFHPKFHATGSQTLRLNNYIDRPFSLEKYVYAYSASYSVGDSYDFLSNLAFYDSSRLSGSTVDPGDSSGPENEVYYQDQVQYDNGENRGWNRNRAGTTTEPMWSSNFVDQCHRGAINSFFMLKQSKAVFDYEYSVEGLLVDTNPGTSAPVGITGSVPSYRQLADYGAGAQKLTYVDTTRDLVTYGQWTTYAPAPSGSFNTTGSFSVMVNDISGVLQQGLGREVNTEDLGQFCPTPGFTAAYYGTGVQPSAGKLLSADVTTSFQGLGNISTGGVHKVQPSPTGSYIMRGICKRPVRMSGSFSFHLGHNNQTAYGKEANFRTSWEGGRSGRGTRPSDPRAIVNSATGMRPTGRAPDLSFLNENNWMRFSAKPSFVNLFEFDDTSPYILLPEDELVFGWQTTIPARFGRATDNSATSTSAASNNPLGYNGHGREGTGPNMTLSPGAGKLILFGSFVKEDKEVLPQSQQGISSNQIHEAIGFDPVSDQFDVAPIEEFAGSMFEQLVTGSMISKESFGFAPPEHPSGPEAGFPVPGKARGIANTANRTPILQPSPETAPSNIIGPFYMNHPSRGMFQSGSFRRNIRLSDNDERYYDSMAGDPLLFNAVDTVGITTSGYFFLGPMGESDHVTGYATYYATGAVNFRWAAAFPFEGQYAGISRLSSLKSFTGEYPKYNSSDQLVGKGEATSMVQAIPGGNNDRYPSSKEGQINLPQSEDAFKRMWFGSGDGHLAGFLKAPRIPGEFPFGSHRTGYPLIRGWKYGLISADPLYSSAVFRRDRFGQFRDLLEFRKNTQFFAEPDDRSVLTPSARRPARGVRQPAVYIRFIDSDTGDTTVPVNTHSQNLSAFSTSSLPYFDGEVRDREDNPDVNEDFTITI